MRSGGPVWGALGADTGPAPGDTPPKHACAGTGCHGDVDMPKSVFSHEVLEAFRGCLCALWELWHAPGALWGASLGAPGGQHTMAYRGTRPQNTHVRAWFTVYIEFGSHGDVDLSKSVFSQKFLGAFRVCLCFFGGSGALLRRSGGPVLGPRGRHTMAYRETRPKNTHVEAWFIICIKFGGRGDVDMPKSMCS